MECENQNKKNSIWFLKYKATNMDLHGEGEISNLPDRESNYVSKLELCFTSWRRNIRNTDKSNVRKITFKVIIV